MTTHNNRTIKVSVPPASEPITLDELKAFLKIDDDTQDAYLTDLIRAGRQIIENYCNISLITQTLIFRMDRWASEAIWLWRPPIQEILSVGYYNDSNEKILIEPEFYYLVNDRLIIKQVFNSFTMRDHLAIEILYKAGYGNASDVPFAIKQALYELVQFMYECKCAEVDLPDRVKALLGSFKSFNHRLEY